MEDIVGHTEGTGSRTVRKVTYERGTLQEGEGGSQEEEFVLTVNGQDTSLPSNHARQRCWRNLRWASPVQRG